MQSDTADFAPVAATWRTGRNVRVVFDSGLFPASIYNNQIVKMCGHARGLRGRTGGRRSGGRHGRQATSADRLRAGIEGLGGGGQAKIAVSCQGRGLRGRTDGRASGYRQSRRRAAWRLVIRKLHPQNRNIHNVLPCRQRRTEPLLHATCTEHSMKLGP